MNKCAKFHKDSLSGKKKKSEIQSPESDWTFRDGWFCVLLCIETICKRATSVAHFDQLFLCIFYEIFTESVSLLFLYHGAKKSKMTKKLKPRGSCLLHRPLWWWWKKRAYLIAIMHLSNNDACVGSVFYFSLCFTSKTKYTKKTSRTPNVWCSWCWTLTLHAKMNRLTDVCCIGSAALKCQFPWSFKSFHNAQTWQAPRTPKIMCQGWQETRLFSFFFFFFGKKFDSLSWSPHRSGLQLWMEKV